MSKKTSPSMEGMLDNESVRFISDAFPSFLSYVDSSERYRFINAAYERHLNVKREDLIGKTVLEVWGEAVYQRVRTFVKKALEGERQTVDVAFDNGFYVNSYIPHIDEDGQVKGFVIFSHDVTDLQASRAALIQSEKMAAIGRLAAGTLHEINTPLGALKSNYDILERLLKKIQTKHPDHPAERELGQLNKLIEASELAISRISETIQRLKNFSRVDEGAVQKIDLHECLDSAVDFIRQELPAVVSLEKQYGHLHGMEGNAGELNQLFLNLLTNAREAIAEAGKIVIRTYPDENNNVVEIEDTGSGIAPNLLPHIFEPNFTPATGRMKAGMGLFISRDIVQRHKGEIKVRSELGKGSVFKVIFPANNF